MSNFIYVFGWFVTVLNTLSVLLGLFVVCRQFIKSVNVISNRSLIHFHFTLLMISFAFLTANLLALYRFYDAWVIKKQITDIVLAIAAFTDRIFMFIVAVGLSMLSSFDVGIKRRKI